jgi:tetratricopeptide (TPR) repeat protein
LLTTVLVLTGCAQQKAYKRGAKLSEEGQYEKAVAELEKAIDLAEDRHDRKAAQRYREKLDETKRLAGQFYYNDAELNFRQADLAAALMRIEMCLKYRPLEQRYMAFRDRVQKAVVDAEQMRAEALSLAEQKQWPSAVERMREALRVHRTLPGGAGDLKQIQERAYQYHVARAQERLLDNDLAAVEAEAQAALLYRENGSEAKDLVRTVANRREAAGLIARGRSLLQQADYEEALRVLQQAQRLHPSQADLSGLLDQARRGVCDRWLSQGRETLGAGEYAAALKLFRKSQDLLPGYGGAQMLVADAKSQLAASHLDIAQQCLAGGYAGSAALHATMALGYEPTVFEAQRQLGLAIGQVRQRVQYTIDFVGFQAAARHQATANLFEAATLEHLIRAKPANVVLVQRSENQTEAAPGADALLAGQVVESRVTSETKQTGQGESVYQDGFRPEPNPDHVHAAAEVDAAVRELEHAREVLAEAEARLARYERADPADPEAQARKRRAQADVAEARQRLVNAAAKVGTAQLRVAATPREVLVPNLLTHTYPIQTVTWTAQISCMVKLLDGVTGELLLAERIEGMHAASDTFVSANPARNVQEDPLELPEDARLLEAAAKSMMGKLRQVLDTACSKHGRRFVTQVQQAKSAGDAIAAVDGCVKYLFAYPTRAAETDAMLSYLRSYLGGEDELIDLRGLLQSHCRVLQR